MLVIPCRGRGRPTAKKTEAYEKAVKSFCADVLKINSTLDFKVSSRGWCYILEEHGLLKADFNTAQKLINACRKSDMLPLDICAEDETRIFTNIESVNTTTPEEEAGEWIDFILNTAYQEYNGFSFWDDQKYYVQMLVEKIDLVGLFIPICTKYHIAIANAKGWADISQRADMMRRFAEWEQEGKIPVLLYCGDHDPAGLAIEHHMKKNLTDLSKAVGWSPDNLVIDRFGLNYNFIEENNLSWIDNLITSNGGDLASPKHNDHKKLYVQNYLKQYGERKVEANALVVRPQQGRQLCLDAVNKYISQDAPGRHEDRMSVERLAVQNQIYIQLKNQFG